MAVPADDFAALQQQSVGVLTMIDAYTRFVAITPSDTIQFAPTRAVYVANAGTLVVDGAQVGNLSTSITFTGMLAGNIYPLRITRAYAAGTSSVGLVGLY